MSHKFLCFIGYSAQQAVCGEIVRTIVGDLMEIRLFLLSWHVLFFFFASELRDYLLGHVWSLKSLDMIKEYIWKDYGVNNPHLGSVGADRKFV